MTELDFTAARALLGLQNEPVRTSRNRIEHRRRLTAKQYFERLRCLVPGGTDPKCDRNRLLQIAIEHLKHLMGGELPAMSQSAASQKAQSEATSGDDTMEIDADGSADGSKVELESREDRKLSHYELDQRRRQQANKHYDEMRLLLPNSSQFNKNAVLHHAILLMQQLSGVSDQALADQVKHYSAHLVTVKSEGMTAAATGGAAASRRPAPPPARATDPAATTHATNLSGAGAMQAVAAAVWPPLVPPSSWPICADGVEAHSVQADGGGGWPACVRSEPACVLGVEAPDARTASDSGFDNACHCVPPGQ